MLKAQDILLALKLVAMPPDQSPTFATVAESLFMSQSEVFAAAARATTSRLLAKKEGRGLAASRVMVPNLLEFLNGGLRYVFPGDLGKPARGFVTAESAPPLSSRLQVPPGELPIVWPHADGNVRGYSLKPLYRTVPNAALADSRLYALLAIADALRTGDARVRRDASAELERLTTEWHDCAR